jgi:hypothetical protein
MPQRRPLSFRADVACWHFSEVLLGAVNFRLRSESGLRKSHDRRANRCCRLFAEWAVMEWPVLVQSGRSEPLEFPSLPTSRTK